MGQKLDPEPLVEAICELRFESYTPSKAALGAFFDLIADEFTERAVVDEDQLRVSLDGSVPKTEVVTDRRYQFRRKDASALVQLGTAAVVINYLPPYGGWTSYRPTILKVLRAHAESVGPRTVVQKSLRYINRLQAVEPRSPIGSLISVTPSLRASLKQPIRHFYQRYELVVAEPNGVLTHQTGSLAGQPVIMLDLDFTSTTSHSSSAEGDVGAWLDAAHELIGKAFVDSLNDGHYASLKVTT